MIILEQGATKMIKRSWEQGAGDNFKKEQREHRKMKSKGKSEKGSKGEKLKGAWSKGGKC